MLSILLPFSLPYRIIPAVMRFNIGFHFISRAYPSIRRHTFVSQCLGRTLFTREELLNLARAT